MIHLRWSPEAADDLERIGKYIQRSNALAARHVVKTIYDGITNLRKFPNRGRRGRLTGSRELVFPSLPYIVAYRVQKEVVEIMRIYHAAQDWP